MTAPKLDKTSLELRRKSLKTLILEQIKAQHYHKDKWLQHSLYTNELTLELNEVNELLESIQGEP